MAPTNSDESDIFTITGQRIKMRRNEVSPRLTLRKLAEMTGITHASISLIENGKTNPSLEILSVLAKHLNTSVSALTATESDSVAKPEEISPATARATFELVMQQWEQDRNQTANREDLIPADIVRLMKTISGGNDAPIDWKLIRAVLTGIAAAKK